MTILAGKRSGSTVGGKKGSDWQEDSIVVGPDQNGVCDPGWWHNTPATAEIAPKMGGAKVWTADTRSS